MGYKRDPRVYTLIFDDPELSGLEVKTRSISIGKLREFMAFKNNDADSAEQTEKLLAAFSKALISWNLEDDNGPVPTTAEAVDDQDQDFIMPIVKAWVDAVSAVDDELGKDSSSGKPSLVASLPMEPLSKSQAS